MRSQASQAAPRDRARSGASANGSPEMAGCDAAWILKLHVTTPECSYRACITQKEEDACISFTESCSTARSRGFEGTEGRSKGFDGGFSVVSLRSQYLDWHCCFQKDLLV